MLEFESDQKRPSFDDVQQLWQSTVFIENPETFPNVERLLLELRTTHSNGGALFACFDVCESSVMDWFVFRNDFKYLELFERFLQSEALAKALPALTEERSMKNFEWRHEDPYTLDGIWASTLMRGGAYEFYKQSAKFAKDVGVAAVADLFEDRYQDMVLVSSYSIWSPWFFDIAWDTTWIGLDKRKRKIWLLCRTDTD